MKSETFARLKARVPEETRIYVRKYSQLLDRIEYLIQKKDLTQKELADALNKKPSEISKWMNTEQNLTLKTICKIEVALGEPLLIIPTCIDFRTIEIHTPKWTSHSIMTPPSVTVADTQVPFKNVFAKAS